MELDDIMRLLDVISTEARELVSKGIFEHVDVAEKKLIAVLVVIAGTSDFSEVFK